jgi:hypothetical protein
MMRTLRGPAILSLVLLAACSDRTTPGPTADSSPTSTTPAVPAVVDGWREYPLRDGVISIRPTKWRTDIVDVPVPAGKGLEYKLTMKRGETLVYNITYGTLADPKQMLRIPRPHAAGQRRW